MKLPSLLKQPLSREFILLAALTGACILWFRSCNGNQELLHAAKRQQLIYEQNRRALTDSLRNEKNKAGDIESVKSAFVSKVQDLEKLNKDLYDEVKREMGNVKSLIKAQATIDRGGLTLSNELVRYPDNVTYGLKFKDTYVDSSMFWSVSGESKFKLENNIIYPGKTDITENRIRVGLVMGFTETDNTYTVFARSSSPLVKFNELDGVLLIPKRQDITMPPCPRKKRFGLGPSLGYGFTQDLRLSPYVGFSLSYNLIQF